MSTVMKTGNDPGGDGVDAQTQIDWSAAVRDSRDWIGRLVVARTGMPDQVEDVIQEVSLAVMRSASRPTVPAEIAPWLCKMVVRHCALVLRNRARQQRKLDGFQQAGAGRDVRQDDPVFWLLHAEQREIVRDELGAMDPQVRQLLIWKYVNALGYQDIASRLGVSRHVAEYRVTEGRKQLRRRLQQRGVDGGGLP